MQFVLDTKAWDYIGNVELYDESLTDQLAVDKQSLFFGQVTTERDSHAYRNIVKLLTWHQKTCAIQYTSRQPSCVVLIKQILVNLCFMEGQIQQTVRRFKRVFSCIKLTVVLWKITLVSRRFSGKIDRFVTWLGCMINCYKGNCWDTCRACSYICKGTNPDFWVKEFLSEHARLLYMTEDGGNLVYNHMTIRFDGKKLTKSQFGLSIKNVNQQTGDIISVILKV